MVRKVQKVFLLFLLFITTMVSLIFPVSVGAEVESVEYVFESSETLRSGTNRRIANVNFDPGFTSVDVTTENGNGLDMMFDLRLDSVTGPIIASWNVDKNLISNWVRRTDRAEIMQEVTGIHDVYFVVNSGEVNTYSLTFNYFMGSKTIYTSYADKYIYEDIAMIDNADEINLLAQLGIFDRSEESFNADLPVSRIDFLKSISKFYNEDMISDVPVEIFKDVENQEDREVAYFLYSKGVIITEDTAYLQPNEYITIYEGAQYASNMLGWNEDTSMAVKLMGGVASDDGYMRKQHMAKILYKAVFADYRVGTKFKDGKYYYEEYNEGILKETRDINKAEGIVSANSYTSIYSAEDFLEDYYVRINGELYNIGETNADTHIGNNCRFLYYEKDNGELVIMGIAPKNPEDIKIYDHSYDFERFADTGITYVQANGKSKKIDFSKKTRIIYNAKALDVSISTVISNPAQFRGKIITIDNDRDGICDVCIINNAKSIVIKSVSEEFIVNKITGEKIDFGKDDRVEFIKNGQKVSAIDFAVAECVDIYISKNAKGKKLFKIVSGSKVEGKIINARKSENEYKLDNGNIYGLSPYAGAYKPSISDIGVFKINTFNEIVYYEKMSGSLLNVGWIMSCTHDDDEESAYMRIKGQDNVSRVYKFAEKVIADGVRTNKYMRLVYGWQGFVGLDSISLDKPILYRVNDNNELTIIDTVKDGGTESVYDQLTCILNEGTYRVHLNAFYNNGSQFAPEDALYVDGALAFTDSDNISYTISPLNNPQIINEDLNKFSVGKAYNEGYGVYTGYAFKKDSVIADLVIATENAGGSEMNPFVFVKKMEVLDENEDVVIEIYGVSEDGELKYLVSNEYYDSDPSYKAKIQALKKGDLIIGGLDKSTNTLLTIDYVHFEGNPYDGTNDTRPGATPSQPIIPIFSSTSDYDSYFWEYKQIKGKITKIGDDYIEITRDVTKHKEYCLLRNVNIVRVRNKANVERNLGVASLYEGQTIIGVFNVFKLDTIYIYESLN